MRVVTYQHTVHLPEELRSQPPEHTVRVVARRADGSRAVYLRTPTGHWVREDKPEPDPQRSGRAGIDALVHWSWPELLRREGSVDAEPPYQDSDFDGLDPAAIFAALHGAGDHLAALTAHALDGHLRLGTDELGEPTATWAPAAGIGPAALLDEVDAEIADAAEWLDRARRSLTELRAHVEARAEQRRCTDLARLAGHAS